MGIILVLIRMLLGSFISINADKFNCYLNVSVGELKRVLLFFRDSQFLQCKSLLDIWAVDLLNLTSLNRYQVTYNVLSLNFGFRFFFRLSIGTTALLSSILLLFPSANWLEREVWDMFGLYFIGHTDLRRILSDYGFVGSPLRKDFPLTGYNEVRYDDLDKRVILEPLFVTQEFRLFDFTLPWEVLLI